MELETIPEPEVILVSRNQIVAEVAKFAVLQSPYAVPNQLQEALLQLHDQLPHPKATLGFTEVTRKTLADLIHKAIAAVPEIIEWNRPKSGHTAQNVFVSRYSGPAPDDDFIDLDALVNNVVRACVNEHREAQRTGAYDQNPMGDLVSDTAPPSEAEVQRVVQWMLDLSRHVYPVDNPDVPAHPPA